MTSTIETLNRLSSEEFVDRLSGIYEHSRWVAELTVSRRPFSSIATLSQAMAEEVANASKEKQLQLLKAHPDLAGRLTDANALTPESTEEQKAAGLDQISAKDKARLNDLNARYQSQFGFPFIICARLSNVDSIIKALEARVENEASAEFETALKEVDKIAMLRLSDL